ncbi:MAG: hypothetical protein HY396_00700 [Candidatus Doudnabacteria bacterium]|nr:hypothetical protein [Candidatus Doudnabacteria bacterium]
MPEKLRPSIEEARYSKEGAEEASRSSIIDAHAKQDAVAFLRRIGIEEWAGEGRSRRVQPSHYPNKGDIAEYLSSAATKLNLTSAERQQYLLCFSQEFKKGWPPVEA